MQINRFIAVAIVLGYRSLGLLAQEEPVNLALCASNRTISVKMDGDLCHCEPDPKASSPVIRDDYNYVPEVGAYKLHTSAKTWNDARKACNRENAHLAVINSYAEESILKKMLQDAHADIQGAYSAGEALIGTHDIFKEGEWVTIFGESIYNAGYMTWATDWATGQQPDNFLSSQNCGALTEIGGMDDVNCQTKFAFFCEIPLKCDNK